MFFEKENVEFTILDVLELHQKNVQAEKHDRSFCAISIRYDSDTEIHCAGKVHDVSSALCFFPPRLNYRRLAKRDNMFVIHFRCDYVGTDLEMFVPQDAEKYLTLFRDALACWKGGQGAYRHKTAAIFCKILAMAYEENMPQHPAEPMVVQAMRMLEENCSRKDFQVQTVANRLHISSVYLRKLFHKQVGLSPKQYLQKKRMEKAAALLETHYFSVAEVAAQCGFDDPHYFSVAFKKHMGVSPTAYSGK